MSTFYPSPPPHQQPRRVLSGGNVLDIPRSYPSPSHQQNGNGTPGGPMSPYDPRAGYNPAMFNGNSTRGYNPRIPSASPHRGGGDYNPQDFGAAGYGRVMTPPVQQQYQPVRPQTTGDPPPPPYSPPANDVSQHASSAAQQPAPAVQVQRLQTQSPWNGGSPATPVSANSPMTAAPYSAVTTPSTAAFSPFQNGNQGATPATPYSPYGPGGFPGSAVRAFSPSAPTSRLQHQTSIEGVADIVPPPPPGPPPQQQAGGVIPPPPPGPPPASQRMESPHRGYGMRSESPGQFVQNGTSPRNSGQQLRSPLSNEVFPRTNTGVGNIGARVSATVGASNIVATAQMQQPSQTPQPAQYQQQQAPPPTAAQAYATPSHSASSQASNPSISADPASRTYFQAVQQPSQGAPVPAPPPKRKMSIDTGHEGLRQSPRLTIPGQPNAGAIAEARSPIDGSNNPWRSVLPTTATPQTAIPPRQLLTPPPTNQEQDLLDLSSEVAGPTDKDIASIFTTAAQRHSTMIGAESSATSDEAAMKTFIEWVKQEWQLREKKYGADNMRKVGAKAGLVLRKTKPMPALPNPHAPVDSDVTMGGTGMSRTRSKPGGRPSQWWGQQYGIRHGEESNPVSPTTGAVGPFSALNGGGYPNRSKYPRSVLSTAFDDDGERSRGRASSRWWETSQAGDSEFGFVRSDGVGQPLNKGRRPTKSSLRDIARDATSRYSMISSGTMGTDAASYMGRAEFPPDFKGGVQGIAPSSGISTGYTHQPPQTQHHYGQPPSLQVIEEQQAPVQRPVIRLDILPLLTLLPPYPREFPAVNNCHPMLSEYRNLVRNLNDLKELHQVTEDFNASSQKLKEQRAMESRQRRHAHSEGVQRLYQERKINYDQVDAMDRDFETEENDRKVADLKSEFERFQKEVVDIVHGGLVERITLTEEAYEQIKSEVCSITAQESASNRDREGDEIPELLEKLTLLKWLFDLRELLYREVHELLLDRNRRYKEVIVTPFYNTRQGDRIREAEEFFTKDEQTRKIEADEASVRRFEEFLDIMEENVTKGVEVQISCFWDIAPLVAECFEKIPHDLASVQPIVPPEEAHENPGYEENPLIYLKEKVFFAERSCYQFVEAQTNLLCLLHEVKTSLVKAKWRLKGSQGVVAGAGEANESDEEKRVTDDLKDKVKLLESEWNAAIGNQFEQVRERLERQVVGAPVVEAV